MSSTNEQNKHQATADPSLAQPLEMLGDPVPNVRFYRFLKINFKFSLINEYTLLQKPSSNDDVATYRFTSTPTVLSQTVRNAIFGITQGFSKSFYKQYTLIVTFQGMSHKEALEFCSKHGTSPEMTCILET